MLNAIFGIIICGIFFVLCSGAWLIFMDKQNEWNERNK